MTHDALAGSDTYDLLAGVQPFAPVDEIVDRARLVDLLLGLSRIEEHELLQIPDWSTKVCALMREAAYVLSTENKPVSIPPAPRADVPATTVPLSNLHSFVKSRL